MNIRFTISLAFLVFGLQVISQPVIRTIKPSDTDPLMSTFNTDSHYIYFNANVTAKNILLVHLPGSFGEPKRATLWGTLAADLGFHSVGLMYPNAPTVGSFCTNSADADCFETVRREIVDGVDYSTELSIAQNEGIMSRVKKLLAYLDTNYPTENWGQYLDVNGDIMYSRVIFSGHSQGGGHAAIIAKYYPVKRAICFSSPKDWRNIPDAPPLWLSSGNWQTARSDMYAFNHVLDEHTNHQLEIWDSLGLNEHGIPVNVDSSNAPYNFTRQLTTGFSVPAGDDHACTIQDNKTPKVSGIPVFTPVWTYMLTHNLTTGISDLSNENVISIKLKPNPTNNSVNIQLPDCTYSIKVYDRLGQSVIEQVSNGGSTQIDLSLLNSGLYFIQATGPQKTLTGKVLKQ